MCLCICIAIGMSGRLMFCCVQPINLSLAWRRNIMSQCVLFTPQHDISRKRITFSFIFHSYFSLNSYWMKHNVKCTTSTYVSCMSIFSVFSKETFSILWQIFIEHFFCALIWLVSCLTCDSGETYISIPLKFFLFVRLISIRCI